VFMLIPLVIFLVDLGVQHIVSLGSALVELLLSVIQQTYDHVNNASLVITTADFASATADFGSDTKEVGSDTTDFGSNTAVFGSDTSDDNDDDVRSFRHAQGHGPEAVKDTTIEAIIGSNDTILTNADMLPIWHLLLQNRAPEDIIILETWKMGESQQTGEGVAATSTSDGLA
jgi:hypothetical protein